MTTTVEATITKIVEETLAAIGFKKKAKGPAMPPENRETWAVDQAADYYHPVEWDPLQVNVTNHPKVQLQIPRPTPTWTSQHFSLPSAATATSGQYQATLLSGQNVRRRAITIANNGTDFIVVGDTESVNIGPNGSGRLYPNQALTFETSDEVWAIANSGTQAVEVWQLLEDGPGVA
jgi:hypothetical protein